MITTLQSFADKLATFQQQAPLLTDGPRTYNGQALFAALLNNELRAQVGDAHRQSDYVIAEYFKAVLLCRENNLAAALAQLQRTDALAPTLPAGTEDFAQLFKLSAWGNYYYKTREADRAIALLCEGLVLSASLERRGFGAFIYRRIEQLQNIGNILFKSQRDDEAHELLRNVLTFMHTGHAKGLFTDDWEVATLTYTRILQEGALHAVVRQIAHQNTLYQEHPQYNHAFYHQFFFQDFARELETDTYNRVILYNWAYVKNSYLEQGPAAFLENTLAFLADEAVAINYNNLKVNLLSQVIWCSRQQAPAEVHEPIIQSIRSFARQHITDHEGRALRLAA